MFNQKRSIARQLAALCTVAALASLGSASYADAAPVPYDADAGFTAPNDPQENFLFAGALAIGAAAVVAGAAYGLGVMTGYHNAAHQHQLEEYHLKTPTDDPISKDGNPAFEVVLN